jgi:hypothetical protein
VSDETKRYSPDQLPIPVSEMALHRKTALTPMFGPISGPCVVETQEGDYDLPEGWRGMLAVNENGFPYPIALASYHETYEPVGTMRIPNR